MATAKKTSSSSHSSKTGANKSTASAKASSAKASSEKGKSSAHGSITTTDHDEIRQWAEARGGRPAAVRSTEKKSDSGLLRIEFSRASADSLDEISWDEFFEKFDEKHLALLYQETTADGAESRFNKIVSAETAAENKSSKSASSKPKTRTAGSK